MNHLEHAADFLAVTLELMDHLGGLLDVTRQPGDAVAGAPDDLPSTGRLAVGPCRHLGGALGIERDILHAGGHLLDGGGDEVGLALLPRSAFGAALHRT